MVKRRKVMAVWAWRVLLKDWGGGRRRGKRVRTKGEGREKEEDDGGERRRQIRLPVFYAFEL